jgi:hypothetical protein
VTSLRAALSAVSSDFRAARYVRSWLRGCPRSSPLRQHVSDSDDTAEVLAQDYNRSAGYAAAWAGDRDRADDLLGEAAATADRLDGHSARQQALART